MTSKGRKKIVDIEVDDLVLTHNGRFKKVVELHHHLSKSKVERTTLFIEDSGSLSPNKIQATSNHPILVKCGNHSGWVPFGEVKPGDQIGIMVSICRTCGKIIPYYRFYCSTKCQNTYDWAHRTEEEREEIMRPAHEKVEILVEAGQWNHSTWTIYNQSEEGRRKASERMKGSKNIIHRPEVKAKVSKTLKVVMNKPEVKEKIARQFDDPNRRSKPELLMREILEKLDIPFREQQRLSYNGQFMIIDFTFRDHKVAIEVDGIYWHSFPERQKKDKLKTELLEANEWKVLRFTDKEIIEHPDKCRDEILRIYKNDSHQYDIKWVNVIETRHTKTRRNTQLYNFSVEDDESYVARGFVVHNCRCTVRPITKEQMVGVRKVDAPSSKIRRHITKGRRITLK
jgi:very-short-patch-repair endonuclease